MHSYAFPIYAYACQEAGQVVWCSYVFQNFPQFIVIHIVKGFGVVKKAEIDVFLELLCFFDDPADVANLISGSSAFSKSSLNIWKFTLHVLLKSGLENFEHYFTGLVAQDFPGGSDGKASCLHCGRPGLGPWVGKILWRRKWQPTPVLLPGKSHGQKKHGGLQSTGSQRVRHD